LLFLSLTAGNSNHAFKPRSSRTLEQYGEINHRAEPDTKEYQKFTAATIAKEYKKNKPLFIADH